MNTVVVYGPQGCGKTSNAQALLKHFECDRLRDDWNLRRPMTEGALHLTSDEMSAEASTVRQPFSRVRARLISFDEAMREIEAAKPTDVSKATNPKDGVGVKKWRQFCTVPQTVIAEVGVGMLEGHLKGYRRHNFRVAGVRSSIYVDAAIGHVIQWWEGEDFDPDVPGGRMSHITKAIASLVVLRDAMIQNKLNDDRPPKGNLAAVRKDMQTTVDALFEKYPNGVAPYTEIEEQMLKAMTEVHVASSKFEPIDSRDFPGTLVPGDA